MTRLLALLLAALFLAFPIRAAFVTPLVPFWLQAGWVLLAVGATLRPVWRAHILLAAFPLLPWVPVEAKGVPFGIVHLLVLSQALPWLIEIVRGRARPPTDALSGAWIAFTLVAVCSAIVQFSGYALVFEHPADFWRELASYLRGYIFDAPGVDVSNMVIAPTTILDGALAFAIVRVSSAPTGALVRTFTASAVAVGTLGIWQAYSGAGLRQPWRINDPGIVRINSTFTDPNALAAYCAALLPVIAGVAGASAARERATWAAGALVVAIALVMTAGRMGMLAALVGLAIFSAGLLWVGLDRQDASPLVRRYLRRAIGAMTVAGLIIVLTLTAFGTAVDARHEGQRTYLHTWLYTLNLRRPLQETSKGRLAIWSVAMAMAADRPVFGVGVGRIYRLFPNYSAEVPGVPERMPMSAHNTFLNVSAELGLVGLAVWLALLALIAITGWTAVVPRGPPRAGREEAALSARETWLALGLLSGACALMTTMVTGDRYILREDVVLLAGLSALIARASRERNEAVSHLARSPKAGATWWLSKAVWASALLVLVTLPVRVWVERRDMRLDRVTSGLHHPEPGKDGQTFRWTGPRAVFYAPREARMLAFKIRSVAPFPQQVEVLVRDTPVARFSLTDHGWREARYTLPPPRGAGHHRIEIRVSPTWTPPNDPRELGAMVTWEFR